MKFKISGSILEFFPRIFDALQINAHFLERVWKCDAVFIFEAARLIHVEISRASRGTEEAFTEARAFLIRPVHEAYRHRWLAVILRVNTTKNFDPCHHVEATIKPTPIR